MWKLKHLFMNAEQGAEQPGGGNGGGEDGGNNPGAGEPSGSSLLSTGAGEPGANDWLPNHRKQESLHSARTTSAPENASRLHSISVSMPVIAKEHARRFDGG